MNYTDIINKIPLRMTENILTDGLGADSSSSPIATDLSVYIHI